LGEPEQALHQRDYIVHTRVCACLLASFLAGVSQMSMFKYFTTNECPHVYSAWMPLSLASFPGLCHHSVFDCLQYAKMLPWSFLHAQAIKKLEAGMIWG